jgi:cell division septal protein FtsQ
VVVGNVRLSAHEITALSGVAGRRIFQVRPAGTAERVAAHPQVREARVTARLPNSVWIEVVETAAVLRWETPTGTFLVDENGRVVSAAADPGDLVRVSDPQSY